MTLRLLVANPNTSADITEKMATTARAIAGPRAAILPDTAPFGASALETEADLAVAADAVAAMLRRADCDGAIIAAFGDPGLKAARAAAPMPVVGLGESGLIVAGEGGR
ncbi:MAG: aspartate/glutamate racemase family protein, partial [Ancalomicrobiaceae bacterium]|nr:aspartate/glutamate racemase family protein [Ancalomicrobiaceae bacterium]